MTARTRARHTATRARAWFPSTYKPNPGPSLPCRVNVMAQRSDGVRRARRQGSTHWRVFMSAARFTSPSAGPRTASRSLMAAGHPKGPYPYCRTARGCKVASTWPRCHPADAISSFADYYRWMYPYHPGWTRIRYGNEATSPTTPKSGPNIRSGRKTPASTRALANGGITSFADPAPGSANLMGGTFVTLKEPCRGAPRSR